MYKFIFTKKSQKEFEKLNTLDQNKIKDKLLFFKKVDNIFDYIKPLNNLLPSTHRIRISNYRLLVIINDYDIIVTKVWHRRDIYK